MLVAQATETPEDQILGYFPAGSKHNIRNLVTPHDPKELRGPWKLCGL